MQKKSDVLISMSEFSEAFEQGRLKLDLNGHYHNLDGRDAANKLGISAGFLFTLNRRDVGKPGSPTLKEAKQFKAWLKDPVSNPPVHNVRVDNLIGMICTHHCPVCGHGIGDLGAVIDQGVIKLLDRCPYPNGMPDSVLQLYCPSGKFVVANDLREVFPTVEPEASVNHSVGIDMTSKAYEQVGMIHCYVGNTCPSMYRLDNRIFTIGARPSIRGAKKVAGVATDLWWYSLADHDEYLDRLDPEWRNSSKQEIAALLQRHGGTVVNCRPGVYSVRHQFPRLRQQGQEEGREPYTIIKWVRSLPKRLPRYRDRYRQYSYTAGQVIKYSMDAWPTLFKVKSWFTLGNRHERLATLQESVAMVADHIFFTTGSGACSGYHPNGWTGGCFEMGDNPPELEIPILTRPVPHCYPLSEWSLIAEVVGMGQQHYKRSGGMERYRRPDGTVYLNPSFLQLAFNYLHAVLRYWVRPMLVMNYESAEEERQRGNSTVEHAQKYFVKLVEQHPDQVPDYAARLYDEICSGAYRSPVSRVRRPTKQQEQRLALRRKAAADKRAKLAEAKEQDGTAKTKY